MTDKEKLREIKVLADAMYNASQYLTTDASRLHDAMEKYHQFVINEYYKEEPVCEDLDAAADKYESEQQEKYKNRDNHDFDNYRDGFVDGLTYTYDAFKAGAQWQKNQTINKACEWLLEELDAYDIHASIERLKEALKTE